MGSTVRRLVVRSSVAAALGIGSMVVLGPHAVADAPCPDGTARVFLSNSTNTCQGAGTASYAQPWATKICTTGGTTAVIDTTGKRRVNRQHIELDPGGHCARLELDGQQSATVVVAPA
ncbi:hypothetical protein [Nocardia sp. NPDC005366]|uniref:hypothetical protein n=1 Tax=Nocardia sp. NPDC005366 TaxID=3156878 RepID=UPI0033B8D53E